MTLPTARPLPRALDLARPLTETQIAAAATAGVAAICRYLWQGGKGLTAAEVRACAQWQVRIVPVFEGRGNLYAYFTAAQARKDAAKVLALAAQLGIPKGVAIYFCGCDFDATGQQIAGGIAAYMTLAAQAVRAAGYRTGVYGNGAMCAFMLDRKVADLAWVWGAMATNGTAAFVSSGRWSIRQHPTVREFGVSVDPDDIQGDYGGWLPVAA
jgi:hypothetical protein